MWRVRCHPSGPKGLKTHAAPLLFCRQSPVPVTRNWHRQLHIAHKWNPGVSGPEAVGPVHTVWTIYVTLDVKRRAAATLSSWKSRGRTGDGQLLFFSNHFISWFIHLSFIHHLFFKIKSSSRKSLLGRSLEKRWYFWAHQVDFFFFFSKAFRQEYNTMRTLNIDLALQEVIGFHVKASKLRLNYHRLTHWHEHMHVSPGVSSPQMYIKKYIYGWNYFMGPYSL